MQPIDVLFVEDDERLLQLTSRYLEACECTVTWARSGIEALDQIGRRDFDVVLLDLMLPGRDGVEICRELRMTRGVPIIMVTARREESDRVGGLDAGADDYVTKPFSSRELVARIRAVVRRARGQLGQPTTLTVGGLIMDLLARTVTLDNRNIDLTSYEFALLRTLAERPGTVLSREQLLDLARQGGAEEAFDRSIDVQISKLRQKLGDDAKRPRYVKTIRGAGYLLATGSRS